MNISLLTDREKEILRLIVKELDCKEIAECLNISAHTVQSHRRNLFKKTKSKTIIGLVNYAYKHQIL
jgi:two-component system, NarL family, nitrate/nitrite response regulator NarL